MKEENKEYVFEKKFRVERQVELQSVNQVQEFETIEPLKKEAF
jgi:hypothetical protein